ncbi:MAG: hypothetical protein KGJ86_20375 [Chloroflexota bacterium]|nr:hypothetical protein [Chloroflexota bacterium]
MPDARTNRDGHLCPSWCEIDHDEVRGPAGSYRFHGGPVIRVELPGTGKTSAPDLIIIRAFHPGHPSREQVVSIAAYQHGPDAKDPHVWLTPADAVQLAAIIDMIDDWDQLRRLLAAIRQAAAQITEASS